ncbi:MetQ/NlpA family ABC transporter substrate-binding protein [Lacticaseibacillus absianus]|uniref:MetQ/NlpA family ABC transporter substrate-binding protein n=1 Tax=Lacticaseibacillus absianus TaxID=2729623 RepID=UPI0015CA52F9|nr:MetQ/NlpA family ABC transporter substrate-binding protein [Lacticaseibacillus absianus]
MKISLKHIGIVAALGLLLTGCGQAKKGSDADKTTTVKIGIVGADQDIWNAVAKKVKKDGITIKIVQFQDYNQPNTALRDGDIDLNAFQHQYFLDNWNKEQNADLISIAKTVIAPAAVYSQKISSLKQLKKGDKISIPNDATNEGRALQLLEYAGLIKLNDKVALPTPRDITENKLSLDIQALDAAQLPASLPDVACSVVNSGVAVDAKLDPKKAIYREAITKKSIPWINIIAARKADKNNATYKKIVKAYQTDDIAKLIKKQYKGTEVTAWNIDLK